MASASQPVEIPKRLSGQPNIAENTVSGTVNVDWLARGSSLKEKGRRCRAASLSTGSSPINSGFHLHSPCSSSVTPQPDSDYTCSEPIPEENDAPTLVKSKRSSTLPVDGQLGADLRRTVSTTTAVKRSSSSKRSWFHNLSAKFHHSTPSPSPSGSPAPPVPSSQTVRSSSTTANTTATTKVPIVSPTPALAPNMYDANRLSRTMSYSAAIGAPLSRSKSVPSSWDVGAYDVRRTSSPRVGVEPVSPVMSPPPQLSSSPNSAKDINRASSLVSKLKRISGKSASPSVAQSTDSLQQKRIIYNYNPDRHSPETEHLNKCLPPRVSFAFSVMERDPPQQIPSRNPRVGNITFTNNGDLLREPLPAGVMPPGFTPYVLPKNYAVSTKSASSAAYDEAQRVAQSVKSSSGNFFKRNSSVSSVAPSLASTDVDVDMVDEENESDTQDPEVNPSSANVKIDTPMHTGHIRSDKKNTLEEGSVEEEDDKVDMSPEAVYTRCCHLREIMPINATLKQIRGRSSPLQIIKMMNPKPTLIEMLALSDFLTIVPVCMVIFDNVNLSNDMIQLLLAALVRSTSLVRLSLKNLSMDSVGWRAFCAFLSQNKSLTRLDLSMHRVKSSNDFPDRSSMDWGLFADSLVLRGGVEELVLTGCMVPSQDLSKVILKGCSPATKRLGLALNELFKDDIDIIRQWVESGSCCCEGLDLGGNHLNESYDFLRALLQNGMSLQFLSLNNAGLSNVDALSSIVNDVSTNTLLKFVDLSSNPDLFPKFTPTLAQTLPRFQALRRIHLDSNNLGAEDVVRLAGAFAYCPSLVHISLLGNELDSTACAALSVATHLSNTIYTIECDMDRWPASLQRRLAHYCMVNMEYMAGRISKERLESGKHDEINRDELMDAGDALAKATAELVKAADREKPQDEANMDAIAQEMVRRALEVRESIRVSLDELFAKRSQNGLSDDEKEELIRLCFLDGTLQKTLAQYKEAKPGISAASAAKKPPYVIADHHLLTLNALDRSVALTAPPSESDPDLKVAPVDDAYIESLSRKSSTTSLHSLVRKQQEVEEGKLHKLGSFLRNYGEDHTSDTSTDVETNSAGESTETDGEPRFRTGLPISDLISKLERLHGPEIKRILQKRDEAAAAAAASTDSQALDSVVDDLAREWPAKGS